MGIWDQFCIISIYIFALLGFISIFIILIFIYFIHKYDIKITMGPWSDRDSKEKKEVRK